MKKKRYRKKKRCHICRVEFNGNKNHGKFEITVITQENLETLLIIFLISDIKNQKKFLWSSLIVLIMTTNS